MAEPIIELNITSLLNDDLYIIPIYQRNYAWGSDEIIQFLQDIKSAAGKYYIGTLVVSEKQTQEQKLYQVVDGQQRHTTISIINAVLKRKKVLCATSTLNLNFEIRENAQNKLKEILRDDISYDNAKSSLADTDGTGNIIDAVKIIESYIIEELDTNTKLEEFAKNFYENVFVFRNILPSDTDVNHYFEIMNTRGEQLEEHEVLKAALMNKLNDKYDSKAFASIWDACSQMNSYLQNNFEANERKELFGESYDTFPSEESIELFLNKSITIVEPIVSELGVIDETKVTAVDVNKGNIESLIANHILPKDFKQNQTTTETDKFTSIIDFPNFLLQVLKISIPNLNVSLDDKLLLKEFNYSNKLKDIDPIYFIISLLQIRYLFDRCIIKREWDNDEWDWTLKRVISDQGLTYRNTFETEDIQEKLILIQSMWHVSFSSNIYKEWLFNTLSFIYKHQTPTEQELLDELLLLAKTYYRSRFKLGETYILGLQTPRFLFNFLDFALWFEYFDKIRGNNKYIDKGGYLQKISQIRNKFQNFKFIQRNSIEHLFPQSRINDLETMVDKNENLNKVEIINMLGNLCLISASSNSSHNDNHPSFKKKDENRANRNESLKQAIMFASFNGDSWNTSEIMSHHKEMVDLLNTFYYN